MSVGHYILGIFITAILGWASWLVVVFNISPFISHQIALTLFYASLFVALTTTFTLLIYYLRTSLIKNHLYFAHLNVSLRQGSLLALMVNIGLVFQRLRVLTWWDALLLLIIVMLIEFYFTGRE